MRVNRDAHAIHLVDVSLLPEVRGRGIGTRLVTALLDEARAAQLPVTLHAFAQSRACSLYRRLGFTETAGNSTQTAMRWTPVS